MERQKITVVTSFHDAHGRTVEATLKSLHWADEVIVMDDESDPKYRPVLDRYADAVYTRKLDDFSRQWMYALERARHEWIFFVASDEVVSPELAEEILQELQNPEVDGFVVPRQDYMYGRWVRYGGFRHQHMRLFRTDKGYWSKDLVHEQALLPEGSHTRTLQHVVYHFSYTNVAETLEKYIAYAKLEAKQIILERGYDQLLEVRGRHLVRACVDMLYYGFKESIGVYFLKAGFLEGVYGVFLCVVKGFYYFFTHAQVYSYLDKRRRSKKIAAELSQFGVPPDLYLDPSLTESKK